MGKETTGKRARDRNASRFLELDPDRLPLTEKRAEYLSKMARIDVKKLKGKKISEAHKILK